MCDTLTCRKADNLDCDSVVERRLVVSGAVDPDNEFVGIGTNAMRDVDGEALSMVQLASWFKRSLIDCEVGLNRPATIESDPPILSG